MATTTLKVPNITCEHCARTIRNELGQLEGVRRVEVNVQGKTVSVDFQAPADEEKIRRLLAEIGYL